MDGIVRCDLQLGGEKGGGVACFSPTPSYFPVRADSPESHSLFRTFSVDGVGGFFFPAQVRIERRFH